LDLKSRTSSGLSGYRLNAAVIDLRNCAARDTDEMVMMRWRAGDVGVSTIGEVNPLDEALVRKEFEEAEDGGASNPEAALFCVGEEIGGGEVPLSSRNQCGEHTAWPGEADPRLVKRFEQLWCHWLTLA
jgi:hypothetical protein